jgi:thiamine-phosphate pyrophosphorylase
MKSISKPILLVISSPSTVPNEAESINMLFEEGLEVLHIRKPFSTKKEYAKLISEINSNYHEQLCIHQYHELTTDFNLKRLHFTEMKRLATPLADLIDLKAQGFKISTSIHQLSSLGELIHFDYTFFSPVFDSISKIGYKSSLGEDFVLEKPNSAPLVIALGGISPENITQVSNMNFDGVAALGTVWDQGEHNRIQGFNLLKNALEAQWQDLNKAVNEYKKDQ